MDMKNKVFVVTGAASGIGLHMVKQLSKNGNKVVATDININKLKDCFSEIDNRLILHHDIADPKDWESVLSSTLEKFKKIDYLLNVAAIIKPGFLKENSIEDIDLHIDINVKGTFYGIQSCGQQMIKQGFGHIINVASLAGVAPIYGIGLYSASKYAVRGYSLAVAQELREHNVFVTVICPDLVKTPMLDLQLNYGDETALTFSGEKPLTVLDIEKAFYKAINKRPMEICIPGSRGITAKIANFFPGVAPHLKSRLLKKGNDKKKMILEQLKN